MTGIQLVIITVNRYKAQNWVEDDRNQGKTGLCPMVTGKWL
jgi:hypothetical protein